MSAKSKTELRMELKQALVERGVDHELAQAKAEKASFDVDPTTGAIRKIGLWIEAPISAENPVADLADEIVKRRQDDLEESGPEQQGNRFDRIREKVGEERERAEERQKRRKELFERGGKV